MTIQEDDEQKRIEANVAVIRAYLEEKFPTCELHEKRALSAYVDFIVTCPALGKSYKLRVGGGRLSDKSSTPERIRIELRSDDVAARMIEAGSDGFYWS